MDGVEGRLGANFAQAPVLSHPTHDVRLTNNPYRQRGAGQAGELVSPAKALRNAREAMPLFRGMNVSAPLFKQDRSLGYLSGRLFQRASHEPSVVIVVQARQEPGERLANSAPRT